MNDRCASSVSHNNLIHAEPKKDFGKILLLKPAIQYKIFHTIYKKEINRSLYYRIIVCTIRDILCRRHLSYIYYAGSIVWDFFIKIRHKSDANFMGSHLCTHLFPIGENHAHSLNVHMCFLIYMKLLFLLHHLVIQNDPLLPFIVQLMFNINHILKLSVQIKRIPSILLASLLYFLYNNIFILVLFCFYLIHVANEFDTAANVEACVLRWLIRMTAYPHFLLQFCARI